MNLDLIYDVIVSLFALFIAMGAKASWATLSGPRQKLNNTEILYAFFRRPLGGARTVFLIHWQALRLKLKGARYRPRPKPPTHEVSHG